MNFIKTYKEGEAIPDCWFLLCKTENKSTYPRVRWRLRLKMPWKARIYTINNDAYQLRHPVVSVCWYWFADPMTHQCTKEELQRSQNFI